jgi:hypothetical protein
MQIVYPYQVQRVVMPRRARGTLRGLGSALCNDREEVQPFYDEVDRLRNEIDALMGQYGAYVPEWLKQKFANQEKQYLKNYDAFKRADEYCYGNWKKWAVGAKPDYEQILRELNNEITRQAAAINASGGAGAGSSVPEFLSPSAPLIPGTSAALNPWLMAGAVGLALFIGYKLMTKVK